MRVVATGRGFEIVVGEGLRLRAERVHLRVGGRDLWYPGELELVRRGRFRGADRLGTFRGLSLVYAHGGAPLVECLVKDYGPFSVVGMRALREIRGAFRADSFLATTYNYPILEVEGMEYFLTYTWGLRSGEEGGTGGRWPRAVWGRAPSELPREDPFSPLVVGGRGAYVAVSAMSHYLVSPLNAVQVDGVEAVVRGLHGCVDLVPEGTTTLTVVVEGSGVVDSLMKWGEVLLKAGGKRRVGPADHRVLRELGYWNCYGGYYSEIFAGFDKRKMKRLEEYFRREGIRVGYFGLDLWYIYEKVGFAKEYVPDPGKYPEGFRDTLPVFLHMSAFDLENAYLDAYPFARDGRGSVPLDPGLYERLAREFRLNNAIGVWHDWLWTQQWGVRKLRCDPEFPDRWFTGMCEAFAGEGLPLMLCMPTVGHLMASTKAPNVIATRTFNDYAFKYQGPKNWGAAVTSIIYSFAATILTIIVGVQFIVFGLLGEMLSANFAEGVEYSIKERIE